MKTIIHSLNGNNVQKTVLRTAALLVSFFLISFTMTAQGYWEQLLTNNSFTRIASTLVENHSSNSLASKSPENKNVSSEGYDFVSETNNSLYEIGNRLSGTFFYKAFAGKNASSGMQ